MSDQLDLILRRSRPSPPAPAEEVVSRARASALEIVSRLQWRRRSRVALVAIAAALAALLVSPVGIGGELAKLLSGTPAPEPIKTSFAQDNEMRAWRYAHAAAAGHVLQDKYSQVIPDEARGVAEIQSIDGPIYLWAAPTEDGRQCWLIQAGADRATERPYGYGSCDGTDETETIRVEPAWTIERPNVKIVHVRLYDDSITRVDLVVEDGHDASLPVASGHALGTIPKPASLREVFGRNAAGDAVARWTP